MLFKETTWRGRISAGLCSFMSDLAIDDYKLRDEKVEVDEPILEAKLLTRSKLKI